MQSMEEPHQSPSAAQALMHVSHGHEQRSQILQASSQQGVDFPGPEQLNEASARAAHRAAARLTITPPARRIPGMRVHLCPYDV